MGKFKLKKIKFPLVIKLKGWQQIHLQIESFDPKDERIREPRKKLFENLKGLVIMIESSFIYLGYLETFYMPAL